MAALLVTACTPLKHSQQLSQKIATEQRQGEQLLKGVRQSPKRQRVTIHQQPWLALKALTPRATRLPIAWNRPITFATGTPLPFSELTKIIHKLSGLNLGLTADAEKHLHRRQQRDSPYPETVVSGIRWQGPFEGLLDEISNSLGLSWRYQAEPACILFFHLDSRTFQIYAIPSKTEMSSVIHSGIDIGSKSNEGGGKESGQSNQKTVISLKNSMVDDIQNTIKSLLTPEIGQVSFSPSTGSVTVTDTPTVLERINRYLDHENRAITQQVLLNIQVLSVELFDKSQLGINWACLYDPRRPGPLIESLGSAFLDKSTIGNNTILKIAGGGKLEGSQWLFNALASQGKVSNVTSPSVTTLNLQPVPVQIGTQKSYLAKVELTNREKGESTVTLTPGMVTYGFNMHLLPFVMPNRQILLQYTINLSEMGDIRTFGIEGKAEIQLPEINTRLFSQKVKLQSGDTLVLSGFERVDNTVDRKGTVHPKNWLLGGGAATQQKRSLIVLTITPVVLS